MVGARFLGAAPLRGTWDTIGTAEQLAWLREEESRLIGFPAAFVTPRGDAPLLDFRGGTSPESAPTFITARLAYVAGLAAMRGVAPAEESLPRLIEHLISIEDDGWTDHADDPDDAPQSLYTLAFVVFASATAVIAGEPSARPLLDRALSVLRTRFWDERRGLGIDKVSKDGTRGHYRGINANMHLVEALLTASDALDDPWCADAAVGICQAVVECAAGNKFRIHEHFDEDWRPLPDHNRDKPDHAYVPYGSTVGHGYEWTRLIVQASRIPGADPDLGRAAQALFERATLDGWSSDGAEGFLYTVGWRGEPVSRQRLHWVPCEALAATAALARVTGDQVYVDWFETWRDHIDRVFLDRVDGSWHHRVLIDDLRPFDRAAPKPDLYHTYQAMVAVQLPVETSVAKAVREARAGRAAS